MDELHQYVKDGYHNYEIGNIDHCLHIASTGFNFIEVKYGDNKFDDAYKDELCDFCVILVLGFMAKQEQINNVEAIDFLNIALTANLKKTVALLNTYVPGGFIKTFYEFLIHKCFPDEKMQSGLGILFNLLDERSPIYQSYFSSKIKSLIQLWYDCMEACQIKSTRNLNASICQYQYIVDKNSVQLAQKKWFEFGLQEFNKAIGSCITSFEIVQSLHFMIPVRNITKIQLELYLASFYGITEIPHTDPGKKEMKLLLEKWLVMCSDSMKSKSLLKGNFFFQRALFMSTCGVTEQCPGIYDIACNYMEHVFRSLPTPIQKIHIKWKDIATHFLNEEHFELSLLTYKLSLAVTPVIETTLRRNLTSNISFVSFKLREYGEAKHYAAECIELDPDWDKGYFRLGSAYNAMEKVSDSISTFYDGLEKTCKSKISFIVEILKVREKHDWYHNDFQRTLPIQQLTQALDSLYKEDNCLLWNVLEHTVFNTSIGKDLDVKHYSLHQGLAHGISNKLLKYLITQGSNINEISNKLSVLQFALHQNLLEVCALLIYHGAVMMPDSSTDAHHEPIVACTEVVLDTGKIHILKFLLKMNIDISARDKNDNTALHLCCAGSCSKVKIDVILLLLAAKIDENVINSQQKTAFQCLSNRFDGRKKCFSTSHMVILPSVIVQKVDQANQTFERKEWESAADMFLDIARILSKNPEYEKKKYEMLVHAGVSYMNGGNLRNGIHLLCQVDMVDRDFLKHALSIVYGAHYCDVLFSTMLNGMESEQNSHIIDGMLLLTQLYGDSDKENVCCFMIAAIRFKQDGIDGRAATVMFSEIQKLKEEQLFELCQVWFRLMKREIESNWFDNAQRTLNLINALCSLWPIASVNMKRVRASTLIYLGISKIGYHNTPLTIKTNNFFKKAFKYKTGVEKELMEEWDKKVTELMEEKKYGTAIKYAFNKYCMATLFSHEIEEIRKVATDIAICYGYDNCDDDAFRFVEYASKTSLQSSKIISSKWKLVAKKLMGERSITVFLWAFQIAPEAENEMRAELKAEMSSTYLQLGKCDIASIFARESIEIIPTYKGYFELGCCLEKLKKFDESWKMYQEAFLLAKDSTSKSNSLARLFKVKVNSPSKAVQLHLDVSKAVSCKTIDILYNDNLSSCWHAIENMFLFSSYSKNITLNSILLSSVMKHASSEDFVLEMIKKDCSIDGDPVQVALRKCWFKVCAYLIRFKKKKLKVKTHPMMFATEMVIETGKIQLYNEVVDLLDPAQVVSHLPPCLLYCCNGESRDVKLQLIALILQDAQRFGCTLDRELFSKNLPDTDPRWPLIFPIIENKKKLVVSVKMPTVNMSMEKIESKKKKKKKVKSISSFETLPSATKNKIENDAVRDSSNLSKEIADLINHVNLTKRQVSESQTEVVLANTAQQKKSLKSKDREAEDICCRSDDDPLSACKDDIFQNPNELSLDGLAWEVECTRDVWNVLKTGDLELDMKNKIIQKLRMLASGQWPRDIAKPLKGVPNGIKLYEVKINKGSRILWEIAISFSARCSMKVTSSDAEYDSEMGAVYVDKIRIWNIALQHDDVHKMIENIVRSHKRGSECLISKHLKGSKEPLQVGNEKLPNKYINENYAKEALTKLFEQAVKSNENKGYLFFPPASPNQQEYHILKFYAFTSAMASRILSLKYSQYDFPFQVSELEHTIIHLEPNNKCPILLLGRSGTGKTTCCLYRLWNHYQNYWKVACHSGPHLPKLSLPRLDGQSDDGKQNENSYCSDNSTGEMVSLNGKTSDTDADYFTPCLCSGPCNCEDPYLEQVSGDEDTFEQVADASGDICTDVSPDNENQSLNTINELKEKDDQLEHLRQLLITKNDVLCHEIKINFHELCQGSGFEIGQELDSLSCKIKDIPADRYPLFITTKKLLLLLDASLDGETFFRRDENGNLLEELVGWGKDKNRTHLSDLSLENESMQADPVENNEDGFHEARRGIETRTKRKEVTYQVFANEIWLKISKDKKSDCHSSLVWMEIKSFIKGCAESFLNESGYLTKEDYQAVGRKRAPNFTGDRDVIYHFFTQYEKVKKELGYFDEMDVHYNIYKRLRKCIVPEWGFHQIYVDETQDFTQAELLLLLRCSLNPNAMFFSGDTAQSIMNGVAFRFCDLKSLFVAAKQELERNKIMSTVVVPKKIHQLTHNYRSHSGILKLASVIVQYLQLLFPESFDHLRPDIGLFSGPKPVILNTSDFEELAMLLQGNKRETSSIEFGAHQVILVQNEQSKEELPAVLNDGLVLSIYEAKGLEFDDVLLYNFFKDSQASDEWRVIATNIDKIEEEEEYEKNLQIITEDMLECETRPLAFEKNKHKLLNSELKKLYTAVTRARVHVWIYDEDKVKRAPMFEMLIKKSLVQVVKLDNSVGEENLFAEKSTPEEWKKQGIFFYERERWELALRCSIKAGDEILNKKCNAQIQGAMAEKLAHEWKSKGNRKQLQDVHTQYRKAAKLFLLSELFEEAKVCLKNSKEWSSLATICEKQEEYVEAGRLFAKTGECDDDALRCFRKAGDVRAAAALLQSRERFIECLRLLEEDYKKSKNYMTKSIITSIANKACTHYHERKSYDELKLAITFLEFDNQVSFLQNKKDCEEFFLQLLQEADRLDLAVQHLMQKQRYLEAADIANDVSLKAECLLVAANRLIKTSESDQKALIAQKLDEICDILDSSSGMIKPNCLYHKMILTDAKENCQYDLLGNALSSCDFEDQRSFLRNKADCEELLLQLFKNHHKYDLAVEHLMKRKRYVEAADLTMHASSKTECLLVAARENMHTDKLDQKILIVEKLEKAYFSLDDDVSFTLKADALFYWMRLSDSTKHITDAIILYKRADNVVGTLQCLDLWQKKRPDYILEYEPALKSSCVRIMVRHVPVVLKLIAQLVNPSVEDEVLKGYFLYFGFKLSPNNPDLVVVNDQSCMSYFERFTEQKIAKHSETSSTSARTFMAGVTFTLLRMFVIDLGKLIQRKILSAVVCSLSCSKKDCVRSHFVPNSASFLKGKQLVISLLYLQQYIQDHRRILQHHFTDYQRCLNSASAMDIITCVFSFIDSFMGYLPHLTISVLCDFFKYDTDASRRLTLCIRNVWEEKEKESHIDVNFYNQVSLLSFIIDKRVPVVNELLYHATSKKGRSVRKNYSFNVLIPFGESLTHLFRHHHVLKALKQNILTLTVPIGNKSLVNPTLGTFCDLLEVPFIVSLTSLSAMKGKNIFFPDSLMAKVNLFDKLYSKTDSSGFEIAISRLKPQRYADICGYFQRYLTILLDTASSFSAFFLMKKELLHSIGENLQCCDRLLVLYLILLVNLEALGFQKSQCQSIAYLFQQYPIESDDSVCTVYNQIGMLKNTLGAQKLLQDFLISKKDRLRKCVWSSKHNRLQSSLLPGRLLSEKISSNDKTPSMMTDQKGIQGKCYDSWEITSSEVSDAAGVKNEKDQANRRADYASEWKILEKEATPDFPIGKDIPEPEDEDDDDNAEEDLEQLLDIERNAAATTIVTWWRRAQAKRHELKEKLRLQKEEETRNLRQREQLRKRIRNIFASKIQKWWRKSSSSKRRLTSTHTTRALEYSRFVDAEKKFKTLNESFLPLCTAEDLDADEREELDKELSNVAMKVNIACRLKNWEDANLLLEMVSTMQEKIITVLQRMKDLAMDEQFEEFANIRQKKGKTDKRRK